MSFHGSMRAGMKMLSETITELLYVTFGGLATSKKAERQAMLNLKSCLLIVQ